MAVGNVTNLGIGTKNSGLNDELIKKLKDADEAGQIKPLTTRLEKNELKQKDLAALIHFKARILKILQAW